MEVPKDPALAGRSAIFVPGRYIARLPCGLGGYRSNSAAVARPICRSRQLEVPPRSVLSDSQAPPPHSSRQQAHRWHRRASRQQEREALRCDYEHRSKRGTALTPQYGTIRITRSAPCCCRGTTTLRPRQSLAPLPRCQRRPSGRSRNLARGCIMRPRKNPGQVCWTGVFRTGWSFPGSKIGATNMGSRTSSSGASGMIVSLPVGVFGTRCVVESSGTHMREQRL